MAPTRVGIIGLSAIKGQLGVGAWAALAIFPSFHANPDYEVVALCNSSVEAARRAIEFHGLPSSTRAYGDAAKLAEDPDIDLVVVSVSVDKHVELALPALEAKKDVYVEWPLGANTEEARKLTELAEAKGVRTLIGLQGRGNPIVARARQLVKEGVIGDITATSVIAAFPDSFPGFWLEGIEKYLDMNYGGNSFKITFAHFLDSFLSVVGDLDDDSISAIIERDAPTIELRKTDFTTVVDPAYPKSSPDHVLVQARLKGKRAAPASISVRTTRKAPDDIGVRWIITGTRGEIEITDGRGQWQIESANKKLSLRLFESGEVREYGAETEDLSGGVAASLGDKAVNTAFIIDGYTNKTEGAYADFASSLKTHQLLDTILERSGYLTTL